MIFETFPRVTLQHCGKLVDAQIALASTFWSRFRGLVCTPRLSRASGLLIAPCNSIHMLGMRYPIEAIFVAKDFQVLKICRNVRPWVDVCCCFQARAVLEWLPGGAEDFGIRVGDLLRWEVAHE
ncbi:hypothetical protein FACS1894185_3760 [Betaproteobacteria bacterium]|nr:hypothetical protein FACS1894185_3760 [Betaproteobacteria bacterium]